MRRSAGRVAASVLGVCAAAALLAACGGEPPPPIVLISIDTLRADRLPAYGYDRIATPNIDRLRADAILFERAYSPAPTTLPAHATMLGGRLPPEHGVRGNVGYRLDAAGPGYLPRALGELGYATGAAVAAFVMRGETGLASGFDFYEDRIDYRADAGSAGFQRSGPETLEAARPWLREASGRPFFLFLHLYDPHTPYTPPEPYASRYESPYDGEIAAVDEVIGELVAELRELGIYDEVAILLTSDHGEGLGDHGESEHGIFVYRESLQVPLLLKLPGGGRAGESVAEPVHLMDVQPTLLELAGGEPPADAPGRSLLAAGGGETRPLFGETFFPRFYFGWSELVTVIEGRHQYIDSPEPELYDLVADPAQRRNLVTEQPDLARELARRTGGYERHLEPAPDTDLETWEKLASLGYVGHGQVRIDAELPAPASQIHLLESIRTAFRHALSGDHVRAVELLRRVVDENPNAIVAWEQLGRSFERLGRPAEARDAYLEALRLSGGAPHLLLAAAETSFRVGEVDRAEELAHKALAWDQAAARALLAETALARGDLDLAEQEARASLALRSPNSTAMFVVAQVQLRRGELEEALATVDETEAAIGTPVPRLGILRANILGSMGRFDEAEEVLRREIERFPGEFAAYTRLALQLARHGRPEEAVETIRLLVERNPTPAGFLAAARSLELLGDPEAAGRLLAEARRRFPAVGELQGADGE